jgi:hypothetical protein
VLVGLFLAMLELIRDRLIWAEQPENSSQIYVRSLTDEPPEQAVQRAIMAVGEAENGAKQEVAQPAQTPPIPIVELPPKPGARAQEPDGQEVELDAVPADDDLVLDEPAGKDD